MLTWMNVLNVVYRNTKLGYLPPSQKLRLNSSLVVSRICEQSFNNHECYDLDYRLR
jgi:hypothetical protein